MNWPQIKERVLCSLFGAHDLELHYVTVRADARYGGTITTEGFVCKRLGCLHAYVQTQRNPKEGKK